MESGEELLRMGDTASNRNFIVGRSCLDSGVELPRVGRSY